MRTAQSRLPDERVRFLPLGSQREGLAHWSDLDSPARDVARKTHIPIIELTPTPDAEAGMFELAGKHPTSSATDSFAQPDDIALVLHTSGTTSRPKIVPLTHRKILQLWP